MITIIMFNAHTTGNIGRAPNVAGINGTHTSNITVLSDAIMLILAITWPMLQFCVRIIAMIILVIRRCVCVTPMA